MIHMPLPNHFQSSARGLPRRVDSLKSTQTPYFIELDDELRDVRRVHAQGQEEDLRYALSRTIHRVEELSSKLQDAYKAQADLQTELTLAKSNLQMALANNEMLEDALKRDPGHSKDVGWRRMSAREQNLKVVADADRRRSTDSLASTESPTLSYSQPSPYPDYPMVPRSATMPSPAPTSEGRFFRFRFGNGAASSSHPSSPRLSAAQSPTLSGTHLTSASLPSLVPPRDVDKELEDLHHQLEAERKAHKQACEAKTALEAELESLSQALFEEANKMVATERMKRAETEDALREAREQGEALKNVLRLFERDSAAAHTRTHTVDPERGETPGPSRSRHRASSSVVGVKSPSSGIPSPHSRPSSPALPAAEDPLSAKTITAVTPSIAAVTSRGNESEPSPEIAHPPTRPERSASLNAIAENPAPASNALPSPTLQIPPASAESPSPSPSPSVSPSPLSAPGQFLFTPPVSYFDGEESPWADATSAATSPKVTT